MKIILAALLVASLAAAQNSPDQHHDKVMKHGEQGMGFSQTGTVHHFLANDKGGAIQVQSKDPNDAKIRDDIRMHLGHIAKAFAAGDFNIPMFVHDTKTVPGVADMQRLKAAIRYKFVETTAGGKVEIASDNPEAIAAVHKFLAFQIEEHRTGDPVPRN